MTEVERELCVLDIKQKKEAILFITIKGKEEAKQEYLDNKQKGNTVAYSEINQDCPDVIKVQLGNIQPKSKIKIEFTYCENLK